MGKRHRPRLGVRAFESWVESQLDSAIAGIFQHCDAKGSGGLQMLALSRGQYHAVECAIFRAAGKWIPTAEEVTEWCMEARAELERRRREDIDRPSFLACPKSIHDAIIADPKRWQAETAPTPMFLGGPLHATRQIVGGLEWANCIHCTGTITRAVPGTAIGEMTI